MKKLSKMILVVILISLVSVLFAQKTDKVAIDMTPNPMKESAVISVYSKIQMDVTIVITDTKGVVLRTIYEGQVDPGSNNYDWDRTDYSGNILPSGKYILELNTDQKYTSVKKIIILK